MTHNYEDCVKNAVLELTTAKNHLQDEIKNYPTPISGCDAQFNHMLSVRSQIVSALNVLNNPVFVPTPRTLTEGSGVESR